MSEQRAAHDRKKSNIIGGGILVNFGMCDWGLYAGMLWTSPVRSI